MARTTASPLRLEAMEDRWNPSPLGPSSNEQLVGIDFRPREPEPVSFAVSPLGYTGGVYVGGGRFTNNQDDQGSIILPGADALVAPAPGPAAHRDGTSTISFGFAFNATVDAAAATITNR